MGGLKRKIVMEKIENTVSRMVTFSKRRLGLYKKASKLCSLSSDKIAILTTPVSSESNVSFFSFGHSSVESVVSDFLADQRPTNDNTAARKGLGFWWEEERLAKSENPKELSDALDSISSMLQNLKGLYSEAVENRREHEDDLKKKKKNDVVLHETHQELDQNQTLNLQSCSASIGIQDDSPASFEGFIKNSEEEDQIVANYDNNMNKDVVLHETHQEIDQNQTLNLQSSSASIEIQDDLLMRFIKNSEEEDQIVAISDNNNNTLPGNLDECNQELDQYFDFLMNCEDLSRNLDMYLNYEAIEDEGAMV